MSSRALVGGLLGALLLLVNGSTAQGQTPVAVGGGSYASAIPAAENVTTDSRPLYVLPGVTAAVPTNDWWTPLILKDMYGPSKYHLWAHPLDFTVEPYGLGVHFATAWSGGADQNQQMVSPDPVRVGGFGFAPNTEKVKRWGDWTVAFRLQESPTEYVDVTIGHGLPFTWLEYTGIASGQVTTDATANYFSVAGASQSFPFTGSSYGFQWQGRNYGVFAPQNTSFTLANGVVTAAFSGADRYLVVAAMPARADLATFEQYAYAVPRGSTVSWDYDEQQATLATTWHLDTQPLQGTSTATLQGFLPHQFKYTTLNFTPTPIQYLSARGQIRCATGNDFQITYQYHGALSNLPAPEVLPGQPHPYDAAQQGGYIDAFTRTMPWLGDANTYGGGKSLTQFARFAANASVLGNANAGVLKTKLRTALANWLTYTPGEPHTYFAALPNFKALMGFDPGFGSEEFNDHHFHYGYHVYAAGVLGLYEPSFIAQYGEMAKLVAKEYANWDRADARFPVFRTFDPWEGHSWANGGYGMNPPIGNNQESTSEAMMAWTGIIQLGLATGDQAMTDAGVFGYVTEAAATNEYWFDRDDVNFPTFYGAAGKIVGILGGNNLEYQTFFGSQPSFIHGIQYLPVLPSSYYLVQNDKFAAAQTEFDFLRARSQSVGQGDLGTWGEEWDNAALQYLSIFNPELAVATQSALGTDPGLAGLTHYTIHSNRTLGRRRFDYHIGATNSGVFFNAALNQFTYCAFNPTTTPKTYDVYRGATVLGTITVPANSFYSTHTLNSSGSALPTVSLTAPVSGAIYTAPATIQLEATASDPDGTVAQVAFYDGATLLGTDTTAPYSWTWTGGAIGLHTLLAQATDNTGTIGNSTTVSVSITDGICTDTVASGDYSYEISTTSGVVSWKFIPLAPIAGSTLAILYVQAGTGGFTGYNMTASGPAFVATQPRPVGQNLTFYFTYRVGTTLTERNSSATPHTYTVGDACGIPTGLSAASALGASWQLHPNPAQTALTVELPDGQPHDLTVSNLIGSVVLRQAHDGLTNRTRLNIASLPKGVYFLTVRTANGALNMGAVTRRFVKE